MKKFLLTLGLVGILSTSISAPFSTLANGTTKTIEANYTVNQLIVNGYDTGRGGDTFIYNGTTYVPIRVVSDALGVDISWEASTQTIYINDLGGSPDRSNTTKTTASQNKETITVSHTVKALVVNGVDTNQADQAFIYNGTTYLPIRIVGEALGVNVNWDSHAKAVLIDDKESNLEYPTDLKPTTNNNSSSSNNHTNSNTNSNTSTTSFISENRAKEIAFAKVGGTGTITEFKSDLYDDDYPKYEIDIVVNNTKHEMDIHGITGAIVKYETEYHRGSTSSQANITEERAKEIALEKSNGGTITSFKSDLYDDDYPKYEIEIINNATKYEIDVHATTGAITDYEIEFIRDISGNVRGNSYITEAEAKEIALAKVGGGAVTKFETDYENGEKEYEVEIWHLFTEYEVTVRASDGMILKYEKD